VVHLPPGLAAGNGRRICIVTNEFHGVFKNGGIGTANTGLALALAGAGYEVTVALASPSGLSEDNLQQLRTAYRDTGIWLEVVWGTPILRNPFGDPRSASYAVYLFLREQDFDVVYFHDNCGRGFYSLLAKHTGCFENAPLLIVVAHGPHEWTYDLNSAPYYNKQPVVYAYVERRSVELADILISPSQYLVDWMRDRGWTLPAHVFVEQNIIPMPADAPGGAVRVSSVGGPVKEIVFFGRMEARKGLLLFCDALDLLKERVDLSGTTITFLGKFDRIDGINSGILVAERARLWPGPLHIQASLDQHQALNYLAREGVLAVIPSLAENSPCVVLECLQQGVPFIATDSGGTRELVRPVDRAACLFDLSPHSMAKRLAEVLAKGQRPARPAIPQSVTIARWLAFHEGIPAPAPRVGVDIARAADAPLVSICIVENGPLGVDLDGFSAILAQTYPRLEVLIIRTKGGARAPRPPRKRARPDIVVRRLKGEAATWAAACNLAAREAAGAFLVFLDSSAVVMTPQCVEVLVRAAERTGAKLVTGVPLVFGHGGTPVEGRDGEIAGLAMGACVEVGAVENCFGDGLALVAREAFEGFGGFPDGSDSAGFWRLFARATVAGASLEVVPLPTFWRRERRTGRLRQSTLVEDTRATLAIMRPLQAATMGRLLERYIDVEGEQRRRLQDHLAELGPARQAIASRLIGLDANSVEAFETFQQYLVEVGRGGEALEFAFDHGLRDGARVRWATQETALEFFWPSTTTAWEVELRTKRRMSGAQAQRITALLDDRVLPVVASDDGKATRLVILGGPSAPGASTVRLRIRAPIVSTHADPPSEYGFAIDAFSVRVQGDAAAASGDAVLDRKGDGGQTAGVRLPGAVLSRPQQPAWMVNGANPAPEVEAPNAPTPASFSSLNLDDDYRVAGYRHLDVTLYAATVGRLKWPELKFKFCIQDGEQYLEFREMDGWPDMFVAFPGAESDEFGRVVRISQENLALLSPWAHRRDKALVSAIALSLPSIISALAAKSAVPREDVETLMTEAMDLSVGLTAGLWGEAPSAAVTAEVV
jgi:glycosyltransferase involved in cell wall biosynthesis